MAAIAKGDYLVYAYLDEDGFRETLRKMEEAKSHMSNQLKVKVGFVTREGKGVSCLFSNGTWFSYFIAALVSPRNDWGYAYDGDTYTSSDGMVTVTGDEIIAKNRPANSYVLLIFPRACWDK